MGKGKAKRIRTLGGRSNNVEKEIYDRSDEGEDQISVWE